MAIILNRISSASGAPAKQLPVVAIREGVIFPNTETILTFGRKKSVTAINAAFHFHQEVVFLTQKSYRDTDPGGNDLYQTGTLGIVQQTLQTNGDTNALVKGVKRVKVERWIDNDEYLLAEVRDVPDVVEKTAELEAVAKYLTGLFQRAVNMGKPVEYFIMMRMMRMMGSQDPAELADQVASSLDLETEKKQEILEITNVKERLEAVRKYLDHEIKILEIEKNIDVKTREKMDKSMKEAVLRERMRTIKKELGEEEDTDTEVSELRKRLKAKELSKEARERVEKELKKLDKLHAYNPERGYLTGWIETVLDLPWAERSPNDIKIENAKQILDADHYGLAEVKERILEHLAVLQLKKARDKKDGAEQPTILCFVGPPGVGKTSIGRSIAKALGRKFVKISLGGIRDEAEIRGHRRTYVGAMPGRIIQGMKTAGTVNPVFMLDEVDKVGADYRGDPSAALLEVLDPEQNGVFEDHYIDMPYNLSEVFFITTANILETIRPALYDRLEIIRFSGYTELEKFHIGKDHLLNKTIEVNGLDKDQIDIPPATLKKIISGYTREAGVRNMEREMSKIMRKVAREISEKKFSARTVTTTLLSKYLGPIRFTGTIADERDDVGMSTGLAWTQAGGDILFIEVSVVPGKGNLTLTGQLGDVMKESCRAALSYVRSRWQDLGLEKNFYQNIDIHIHVPEGAVPKDGPSAGVAITTALVSALTGKATRKDTAMTGEVTLRGRVLEIGGVKEKVIAAHRAGIKRVIMPESNRRNMDKVPDEVKKEVKFFFTKHMDQVLKLAMAGESK